MSKSKAGVLLGALVALSGVAQAEVGIRVRAGIGLGQYSVDSNLTTGGFKVKYDADYTTVPVGITLITDNDLYVDLVHQTSSGNASFSFSSQEPDFERDDTTLTIGARKGNASFYVGYKTSEAITDWPSGTGIAPDKLSTSGFLAGVGWAFPFSSSALNISGGVGVLNGTYTFSPTSVPLDSDTTLGYSVSAGYTYAFKSGFSINADIRWQQYSYDFGPNFIEENPAHGVLSFLYTF